jgi:hypothetical protein
LRAAFPIFLPVAATTLIPLNASRNPENTASLANCLHVTNSRNWAGEEI